MACLICIHSQIKRHEGENTGFSEVEQLDQSHAAGWVWKVSLRSRPRCGLSWLFRSTVFTIRWTNELAAKEKGREILYPLGLWEEGPSQGRVPTASCGVPGALVKPAWSLPHCSHNFLLISSLSHWAASRWRTGVRSHLFLNSQFLAQSRDHSWWQ